MQPLIFLGLWILAIGAMFLPLHERYLRALLGGMAVVLASYGAALYVPLLAAEPWSGYGLLIAHNRVVVAIPLLVLSCGIVASFLLWWSEAFRRGSASRRVFTMRSATLLLMLFLVQVMVYAQGVREMFLCALGLFAVAFFTVRSYTNPEAYTSAKSWLLLAMGGSFVGIVGGMLLGAQASTGALELFGAFLVVIGCAMVLGVYPVMLAPCQRALEAIPRGHALVLRALMPFALLPSLFTLQEARGLFPVLSIVLSVGAYAVAARKLRLQDGVLFASMASAVISGMFGAYGEIPAMMFGIVGMFSVFALTLSRGGVLWSTSMRRFASFMFAPIPGGVVFLPLIIGFGYGSQDFPFLACLALVGMASFWTWISWRITRAWSEDVPSDSASLWGARLGFGALVTVWVLALGLWTTSGIVLFLG